MRIEWTKRAAEDFYAIRTYIYFDNPAAARRVARTIFESCQSLAQFPNRGRKGVLVDTRELVVSSLPYIAVYRVRGEKIVILRTWHGAQNR